MDSDDSDTAKAKAKAERKAARKAEKKRLAAAGEPVPEKKKKEERKTQGERGRRRGPEEEEKGQDRGFVLRRHGDGLKASHAVRRRPGQGVEGGFGDRARGVESSWGFFPLIRHAASFTSSRREGLVPHPSRDVQYDL